MSDPAPVTAATRTIFLLVQFDGSDFSGWQWQPQVRTVQGILADAVTAMVHHEVTLFASSRTDAGVHARAMPVCFDTSRSIPCHGFLRGLNAALPQDVAVLEASERPLGWRSRDAALAKTYRYRLYTGPANLPLFGRYAWHVRREGLRLAPMREAAEALVGTHDFAAFRSSRCVALSTERCMHAVTIIEESDPVPHVVIEVIGNAFLHNMVRIIAGTLAEVGTGRYDGQVSARALASGQRSDAGRTAPSRGLTLHAVHFAGYPRLGK